MPGPAVLTMPMAALLGLVCFLIAMQPWLLKRLWTLWNRDRRLAGMGQPLPVLRKTWPFAAAVFLGVHAGLIVQFGVMTGKVEFLPLLAGVSFATLLLALVDWRCLWLPDMLVVPLGLLGAIASLAWGEPWYWPLLGAGLGYAAFALLRVGYHWLRGLEGLGGGDVRLAGAMGAWLGPLDLPFAVFLAAMLGLLTALMLLAVKARQTNRLPFGSFLCLGLFLALVFKLTG